MIIWTGRPPTLSGLFSMVVGFCLFGFIYGIIMAVSSDEGGEGWMTALCSGGLLAFLFIARWIDGIDDKRLKEQEAKKRSRFIQLSDVQEGIKRVLPRSWWPYFDQWCRQVGLKYDRWCRQVGLRKSSHKNRSNKTKPRITQYRSLDGRGFRRVE